jgi:hypothetical protein
MGATIEAMLLTPVLRPMVQGAGLLGDYELDVFAQEMAWADTHGFAALIAARLESAK